MTAQLQRAIELYADLAQQYDAETRFITGIRSQAIAALRLRPGESVLDAGCGTGWCLPMLAKGVGVAGKVQGFEPSPDMLALARKRVAEDCLHQVELQNTSGAMATLTQAPDAILFSYTHDLIRSRASLEHLFAQCRPGTRIVAAGTKLFPTWFFPGNWYLRHTHRATITNFEGFESPWTLLAEFCPSHNVRVTIPGSRYLFTGVLGA